MRLIDADALTKEFPCTCGCKNCGQMKDGILPCDIKDKIKEAPTIDSFGSWIPCSERLPDLFEVVLVTDECGNVFEYERRPLDYDGNVCREWSFIGRNIIAWMPLPNPYEVKSNEV